MLDSLANVKTRLGITGTTYDTFLTSQIQLVSDVIEAYCRRKFLEASYTQTFYKDDIGSVKRFELFQFPVSSVDSLQLDGVDVDTADYRLHSPTGTVIGKSGFVFCPTDEMVVEYTAGYPECPSPVLSVLDSIVGERYNKKVSGVDLNFGSDVQRISIPGAISIDFDYTLKNNDRSSAYGSILGNNANILDDWRSERAIIGSGKLSYVEE